MATRPLDPAYYPLTAEEFVELDLGTDRRAELENGAIYMMTGGSNRHAMVQANLGGFLRSRLRGSGCRPYGPDMGVKTTAHSVRYPDVSVYCGKVADPERDGQKLIGDPLVIFEILSPSTSVKDQTVKLEEYQALAGVDTIVFVDPDRERARGAARRRRWLARRTLRAAAGCPTAEAGDRRSPCRNLRSRLSGYSASLSSPGTTI